MITKISNGPLANVSGFTIIFDAAGAESIRDTNKSDNLRGAPTELA